MTADGPTAGQHDAAGRAWRLLRRFGPLFLVFAALVAAFASGLTRHLSLHELRARREALETVVHAHPVTSLALYFATYTTAVAVSLPAALILTLTGGLLFGAWIGGLAAALSCTLGAAVVFLICRTALGDTLRGRAGPTVMKIGGAVRRDAFSYILTLRLVPVMPFWLANLALGFIDIPLRTFVLASFLGILPVSLIYAGLGSGLDHMFRRHQHVDLNLMMHANILLPLIGLAVLSLAPVVWRQLRPSVAPIVGDEAPNGPGASLPKRPG